MSQLPIRKNFRTFLSGVTKFLSEKLC